LPEFVSQSEAAKAAQERVIVIVDERCGLWGGMSETRKLAAILVSDVVGYSRLMGADEDRILARLQTQRSDLIDPSLKSKGRWSSATPKERSASGIFHRQNLLGMTTDKAAARVCSQN
jgi:hypothetical protein